MTRRDGICWGLVIWSAVAGGWAAPWAAGNWLAMGFVWTAWIMPGAWLAVGAWEQATPAIPLAEWLRMRRLGYRYDWPWKRFVNKDGNQEVNHRDAGWEHTQWAEWQDGSARRKSAAASPVAAHVLGQINTASFHAWGGDL